jgi:hypothetical protein
LSGGGAVRIFTVGASAILDVRNLTIANGRNYGHGGGGIYNDGTLTLTNSTLSGNSAVLYGGGIYNSGTLTLTHCTLSGNSADFGSGGGIYNTGTLTLTNSTLSGNSTARYGSGGGIYNTATLTLTNCTLSGNSAAEYGGGIFNVGSKYVQPGTLTLGNTVVANSPSGGDCFAGFEITDDGHNLIEDATNSCGLTNGVNGNIVGVDPLLGPLANNGGPTQTHALCTGPGTPHPDCPAMSPAIDAGDAAQCPATDQRGAPRPYGATCDIGAYESGAQVPVPCVGDCGNDGEVTIDELLTIVNIALGTTSMAECGSGDADLNEEITIDEILTAVNNALNGCSGG